MNIYTVVKNPTARSGRVDAYVSGERVATGASHEEAVMLAATRLQTLGKPKVALVNGPFNIVWEV